MQRDTLIRNPDALTDFLDALGGLPTLQRAREDWIWFVDGLRVTADRNHARRQMNDFLQFWAVDAYETSVRMGGLN